MSPALIGCPAPAKINLFLHVTGRREDGYHFLQTAFRLLDYGDLLDFHPSADGEIRRRNDITGVPAEEDLVVRAGRLLQHKTGYQGGVEITLHKKLPMGGGLGGGSSDAATTLLALNHLWQLDVPRQQLAAWALELGADVPFFIFGQTALGEGVGEALKPLALPPSWYVVIEPPVAVPTAEIFRSTRLTRDTLPLIMPSSADDAKQTIRSKSRNDLQPVACHLYPVVQQAIDALTPFGAPRMSGSGSCVFLDCGSEVEAKNVVAALSGRWKAWCAPSMDLHPLRKWASD